MKTNYKMSTIYFKTSYKSGSYLMQRSSMFQWCDQLLQRGA